MKKKGKNQGGRRQRARSFYGGWAAGTTQRRKKTWGQEDSRRLRDQEWDRVWVWISIIDSFLVLISLCVCLRASYRPVLLGNCPSALPVPTKNPLRCRNLTSTPGLLSFSLPLCLFLTSLSHLHMNPNWAWGMVGGWPPLREMIALDEEEEKLPYREIGIRVAYTPAAALQISVTNNFLIFHITEHFGNWWNFFYRDEEGRFILLWNDAAGDRRTSVIYNDTTSKHIRYSRINVVCYSLLARVRVRNDVRLSCNNFLHDEWTSNEQPWGVINCRVCKNDTLL